MLLACNLGDSGYIVLRGGSIVAQSEFQRDESQVVKQLAIIPQAIAQSTESFEYCDDSPLEALTQSHLCMPDDNIILATDGMFDNIHEDMLSLPFTYGIIRMRAQNDVNEPNRIKNIQNKIENIVREAISESRHAHGQSIDDGHGHAHDHSVEHEKHHWEYQPKQNKLVRINQNGVDLAHICARLLKHSCEYMRKPEGKPDDCTIIVTQLMKA